MSAEGEEHNPASYDSRCIFCKISNNQEGDAELLHSDEDLTCFRDIRPGAPHHYLVVPKKHIGNCKTLTNEHVSLVMNMVEVGKNVLQKNHVTNLEDIRLGFHWPPFCSISHLHLHVLAPASQLGFLSKMIYRLNSYWFITAEQLIERLQANTTTS
ncbi:PREDICTED: histidine triad nucleotide-binding protein 3 [Nanorana parkeri]|uniref:histidine triad nucleotide-binding protein 3 n=1 Tax=Nanorana parkeri TaxID=125878 RepID=UPI000854EAC6|nr:PREDICTED: histidine triad nucleotide-binding protein 3 [Nanorana parkeri]